MASELPSQEFLKIFLRSHNFMALFFPPLGVPYGAPYWGGPQRGGLRGRFLASPHPGRAGWLRLASGSAGFWLSAEASGFGLAGFS